MYIPINPEYIIAYYEKPINLSRLIRILHYEIAKRRILKIASHTFGIS